MFTWQIEGRSEELLRVIVTSVTMSLLRRESVLRAFLLCGVLGSVSL